MATDGKYKLSEAQIAFFEGAKDSNPDPKLVRHAIAQGADVNMTQKKFNDVYDDLPVWVLLADQYDDIRFRKNPEALDEVLDIICAESLDVTTRDYLHKTYTDQILGSYKDFSIDNVAKVVTATIHDSVAAGGMYDINYRGIFVGKGDDKNPYQDARVRAMTRISSVVNRVQERLRDPQTEKEKRLAADYPQIVQKWLAHTPPDLAQLPMPSSKTIEALDNLQTALLGAQNAYHSGRPDLTLLFCDQGAKANEETEIGFTLDDLGFDPPGEPDLGDGPR